MLESFIGIKFQFNIPSPSFVITEYELMNYTISLCRYKYPIVKPTIATKFTF